MENGDLKNKLLLRDRVISSLIRIIKKQERTFSEKVLYFILVFLSKIYEGIIKIRLKLFRWGLLKNRTLGCLVISVGNITTGGTGKTPIVQVFARALTDEGRKVAVLTRGYRRRPGKNKKDILVVVGDSQAKDAYEAGDEAFLLARNLKTVPVVIGKDRLVTGEYAINKLGADTLILDDGYQYLSLNKRVNIVCVDANNPFGNGNLIPAGFLREPLGSLGRANLFFLTKVQKGSNGDVEKIYQKLKAYNKEASIIETTYVPKGLVSLDSGNMSPIESLQGKRIITLSAIADPEGFEKLVKEQGVEMIENYRFPDHHYFTEEELSFIDKRARSTRSHMIMMTEKDFVKVPAGFRFKSPSAYLKVDVTILKGADNFTDCISKLCFT